MTKRMVLIAEDEQTTRMALQMALVQKGYEVHVAVDGSEAIDKLKQHTFDVVLLDLIMPKIKGVEVLAVSQELAPYTAFVVFTAHASTETAITALRSGVIDYLRKPASFDVIFEAIERGIAKHDEWVKQKKALTVLEQLDDTQVVQDANIQTNAFLIDTSKQQIYYHETLLKLTPSEYQLLSVLIQNRDIVVSYTQLVQLAYDILYVDEGEARRMVKTHLYRLGKKLKKINESPLETVRGRGILLSDK